MTTLSLSLSFSLSLSAPSSPVHLTCMVLRRLPLDRASKVLTAPSRRRDNEAAVQSLPKLKDAAPTMPAAKHYNQPTSVESCFWSKTACRKDYTARRQVLLSALEKLPRQRPALYKP